jgi:hypothetical protein
MTINGRDRCALMVCCIGVTGVAALMVLMLVDMANSIYRCPLGLDGWSVEMTQTRDNYSISFESEEIQYLGNGANYFELGNTQFGRISNGTWPTWDVVHDGTAEGSLFSDEKKHLYWAVVPGLVLKVTGENTPEVRITKHGRRLGSFDTTSTLQSEFRLCVANNATKLEKHLVAAVAITYVKRSQK